MNQAQTLLRQTGGLDEFFVRKWKVISRLFQAPDSKEVNHDLLAIRKEAGQRCHWETVRECDFHSAIATQDERIALHVYFGTPFHEYRERLLREMKKDLLIPKFYGWEFSNASCSCIVNPFEKDLSSVRFHLKAGQLKYRLLGVFVSDFYRPHRQAAIFSSAYPGEQYNPVSSPTRVYQAIKELRQWFMANHLPFVIKESSAGYAIEASKTGGKVGVGLAVPSPAWWQNNQIEGLSRLRESANGAIPFTAKKASDWLKIPRRSLFEILKKVMKQGEIERIGSGSSSRYRFLQIALKNAPLPARFPSGKKSQ
mgnify:CR=1 FL=1